MNWIFSPATRAGLGAPEWIVIAIIVAAVLVAALETRGSEADPRGILVTRRQKWTVAVLTSLRIALLFVLAWGRILG